MQNGPPALGEIAHDLIDRRLGGDVDAARRLAEDEHFGIAGEPAGDDDLLLIAARKQPDLLSKLAARTSSCLSRRSVAAVDIGSAVGERNGRRTPSGSAWHCRAATAASEAPHASGRRRDGRARPRSPRAGLRGFPGRPAISTAPASNGSSPEMARPSASCRSPRDPPRRRSRPYARRGRCLLRRRLRAAANLQRRGPGRRGGARRIEVGEIAADHRANEPAGRRLGERRSHDRPAVLQHGHPVGDRLDLRHPVRDVDDRDPCALSRRTSSSSRVASTRSSAAVGSSMTRMRASMAMALAISTIC